jgi:hypothetical protein
MRLKIFDRLEQYPRNCLNQACPSSIPSVLCLGEGDYWRCSSCGDGKFQPLTAVPDEGTARFPVLPVTANPYRDSVAAVVQGDEYNALKVSSHQEVTPSAEWENLSAAVESRTKDLVSRFVENNPMFPMGRDARAKYFGKRVARLPIITDDEQSGSRTHRECYYHLPDIRTVEIFLEVQVDFQPVGELFFATITIFTPPSTTIER